MLLYGFVVFMVLPVKQEPILFFIYGLGILLGISDCEWVYRASGKYSFLALVNAVFRCLAIVAVYLLVRNSTDLYWYAFITLLAGSGSLVAGFLLTICVCLVWIRNSCWKRPVLRFRSLMEIQCRRRFVRLWGRQIMIVISCLCVRNRIKCY